MKLWEPSAFLMGTPSAIPAAILICTLSCVMYASLSGTVGVMTVYPKLELCVAKLLEDLAITIFPLCNTEIVNISMRTLFQDGFTPGHTYMNYCMNIKRIPLPPSVLELRNDKRSKTPQERKCITTFTWHHSLPCNCQTSKDAAEPYLSLHAALVTCQHALKQTANPVIPVR